MKLRTFLVEDDEHARTALTALLRTVADLQVVGYATAEDSALTWLVSEPTEWDLAVVDLMLARGSGLRVLTGCRVRRAGQKMVVLTNHADKEMRRRCLGLGADAVFDKTNELEALLEYCTQLTGYRPPFMRRSAAPKAQAGRLSGAAELFSLLAPPA